MSIIRIVAIDPKPRPESTTDLVVYQVPENSREAELLCELFADAGIEYAPFETPPRRKKETS